MLSGVVGDGQRAVCSGGGVVSFYSDMAGMAKDMLTEYNQGTIDIGRTVVTAGANSWDAPSSVTTYLTVMGIVRGVSRQFVDGVTIMATDLQVIAYIADYEPLPGDLMEIDGNPVAVLRQDKIPGAGTTACWRFIVRA